MQKSTCYNREDLQRFVSKESNLKDRGAASVFCAGGGRVTMHAMAGGVSCQINLGESVET